MTIIKEVLAIVKEVAENTISKEDGVIKLQDLITEDLAKIGIFGLNGLSEVAVLSVLFYLYGLGIINPMIVENFVKSPYRTTADFFNIALTPSQDDKAFVMIEIKYAKRKGADDLAQQV